ncbi:sugar ABC transporter ATP-binding protein [Microbacterium sp. SA39]|uniref:sugar ABC transporter ATP-binding protein n=1 Tax=Microbacterium sp. SA39 TaxID=1263625 RepID=UPI0005FA150E|nr:sugar ABC transporter ATP-binding protein [Microbacterium sp. SA39]KJQ52885.1 Ribose import ATP-binding protein RbsA [Microbacterium sp. SA39]
MSTEKAEGLRVRGARKVYPGTVALDGVDLEVRPGELVALLGENGAGKSTLSSIIAGVARATEVEMTWNGDPYAPADPREAIAAGIGLIHQEMRLLPDLTVAENVAVGRWPLARGLLDARRMRRQAMEQLDRLGFAGHADQLVSELSVAGQQQVEIAKALLLDASLLILDEPTAALGAAETDALFATVQELKKQGMSFIYVSHRLSEIRRIADRIVVLRDGAKVAEHSRGDVDPEQLVSEMVGRSVDRLFPPVEPLGEDAPVVLQVAGLTSRRGHFSDVSFDVRAGEVLGIAGIVGAGRTEIVRAVASADPHVDGTVSVGGRPVRRRHPADAIAAGIVLVPEDRKHQGLVLQHSIADNIALPNLPAVSRGGWIGGGPVQELARTVSQRLGVKGRPQDDASSMSGGNQQKVVIGKWLERGPRVIILDEPTRGIDVGARAAIYDVIADMARAGAAVVVVSSDLEEVLGLAHRVMVIAEGTVRGMLSRTEATPERVMGLAAV